MGQRSVSAWAPFTLSPGTCPSGHACSLCLRGHVSRVMPAVWSGSRAWTGGGRALRFRVKDRGAKTMRPEGRGGAGSPRSGLYRPSAKAAVPGGRRAGRPSQARAMSLSKHPGSTASATCLSVAPPAGHTAAPGYAGGPAGPAPARATSSAQSTHPRRTMRRRPRSPPIRAGPCDVVRAVHPYAPSTHPHRSMRRRPRSGPRPVSEPSEKKINARRSSQATRSSSHHNRCHNKSAIR